MPHLQIPYFSFWSLFFGLCIGSFLNVVIYRLPKGKSVVTPRSFCPACEHAIPWYDNIPLFSFLWLKGKCRHCKAPISFQYFFVELLTALFSLATWVFFQDLVLYFAYFCLFIAPLIAVIFIDLQHRIIPNEISLSGILFGIALHAFEAPLFFVKEALFDSILGVFVGGGFLYLVAWGYEKIKKREGLGGGDVKLAAMCGAFFGWQSVLMILLVASVLGSLIGLIVVSIKKDWRYALPFGPFLAVAGFMQLFFGRQILQWYLSLFYK